MVGKVKYWSWDLSKPPPYRRRQRAGLVVREVVGGAGLVLLMSDGRWVCECCLVAEKQLTLFEEVE